jgi:hypothetical protein
MLAITYIWGEGCLEGSDYKDIFSHLVDILRVGNMDVDIET